MYKWLQIGGETVTCLIARLDVSWREFLLENGNADVTWSSKDTVAVLCESVVGEF